MSSLKIKVKGENVEGLEEDIEIIDGIPISKLSITGKIPIPSPIRKKSGIKQGIPLDSLLMKMVLLKKKHT
jgi:hypothetical protein